MFWIFATNHHHHTIAANDFAAITARFHRGAYFHVLPLLLLRLKNSQLSSRLFRSFKAHSTLDSLKAMRYWTVTQNHMNGNYMLPLYPVQLTEKDTDRRKGTMMVMCAASWGPSAHQQARGNIIARAMLCALVSGHRGTARPSPYHLARYVWNSYAYALIGQLKPGGFHQSLLWTWHWGGTPVSFPLPQFHPFLA